MKAFYSLSDGDQKSYIHLNKESFGGNIFGDNFISECEGLLVNVNTLSDFKDFDKKTFLDSAASIMWNKILSGEALSSPTCLSDFAMLTFADLKAHKFTFWCAFPAFVPAVPFQFSDLPVSAPISLVAAAHREVHRHRQNKTPMPLAFGLRQSGVSWTPTSLSEVWPSNGDSVVIAVMDTGTTNLLGWAARNVLALLTMTQAQGLECVRILAMRAAAPGVDAVGLDDEECLSRCRDKSLLFSVALPTSAQFCGITDPATNVFPLPRVVGWETNERGKPGPRQADLSLAMNGERRMAQAVDLNLRLMRWRLWPTLDTDMLAAKRCLLLGAGTLGCAVARVLLGWGVRHITFVDNGVVSYSNPARQCLFEFADCAARRPKAVAAADRLRAIFPGVRSQAHVLTIPMPGRQAVGEFERESQEAAVDELDALILCHDYVFALTDSREARWLPTVACAAHDKTLLNAALGFDSYLVLRHGAAPEFADRVGCYFCNDVSAPGSSGRERTLDQQCTVTRPGLAYIAGSLAVELMVSLAHSPLGNRHPPPPSHSINSETDPSVAEPIDPIPHQLRGYLHSFSQSAYTCPAFSCCTACSAAVVAAYRTDRKALVRLAADPEALEQLSGASLLAVDLESLEVTDDDHGTEEGGAIGGW